jgi:hypothetical protein
MGFYRAEDGRFLKGYHNKADINFTGLLISRIIAEAKYEENCSVSGPGTCYVDVYFGRSLGTEPA